MGSGQTPSPENGEREAPAAPASQAVIETTPRQRWIALAILLAATFMNLIDVTIVNVALPTMQEAFSASTSEIEWVVAVYVLALAMGLMPFGRMGDIVGRRNMFVLGVAVFTIASAMCGFSGSMTMLIVSRIVQGLGAAMMTPQTIAITQVIFPPRERAA
ncbi:MAG: MFS transporter, partial [Rhizobiaceae bacterium]|nr:MFS transporter [Rhizobiaceae bacterium]